MSAVLFVRLLHILSVGLFAGALLSMMWAQSYLQRALDDGDRKSLSTLVARVTRLLVGPMMIVGWLSGLTLMFLMFTPYGAAKVMACTPVYVHVMLLAGTLALGLAQMWGKKARQVAEAVEANASADARGHLSKGWLFAWLALAFTLVAFVVATLRVPNPPQSRCVPPGVSSTVEHPPA